MKLKNFKVVSNSTKILDFNFKGYTVPVIFLYIDWSLCIFSSRLRCLHGCDGQLHCTEGLFIF